MVALFIIATATMTIVLMGLTLTGAASFGLIGAILATPALFWIQGKLDPLAQEAKSQAQIENCVANSLKEISEWDSESLEKFFQDNEIPHKDIGDLKERLVLIARFLFWDHRAETMGHDGFRKLAVDNEDVVKLNTDCKDPAKADNLRHQIRCHGFYLLEEEAIPAILQSALMLELIANPFQELEIAELGQMSPKPMMLRLAERRYDDLDVYFTFKDKTRKPLNSEETLDLFAEGGAPAVRQRMFAKQDQVNPRSWRLLDIFNEMLTWRPKLTFF